MRRDEINLPKQQGAILIITLLFLSIATVISVFALTQSQFEIKMTRYLQIQLQTKKAADRGLIAAESQLLKAAHLPCELSTQQAQLWVTNPKSAVTTCQLQHANFQVEYIVEKIQADPCARYKTKKGVVRGIQFWRITSRAQINDAAANALLQSTLAQADDSPQKCLTAATQIVTLGRQSWRQIR